MRIILAGTGSAVGKTTIATGIMKALSEKYDVQPFKVGPDYIDPSYHTLATGNTSRNLDSFFMKEGQVRDSFLKGMEGKDIAVIEGVRGLYEGIDSINDIGSTASVAKSLKAPVILIINSRSLVKSAAALVLGFKALDPEINIAGVILNKVKNQTHYEKTKRSIEEITKTEVIGGIIRDESISIEQRHLGLVPARERETSIRFIDIWSKTIKESIDLDRLVEIAKSAPKITSKTIPIWNRLNKQPVDGLYIGGGYPELFSKELSANLQMLRDIKQFHNESRPIFAECGGLMYLMNSIHDDKVVDIYPYKAVLTDRVQALKYTIAEVQEDNIISKKGETFHGHEFHYSKVIVNDLKNPLAFRITRGKGSYELQDGFMEKNTLASYVHTHVAAMPDFAGNLCISARELGD